MLRVSLFRKIVLLKHKNLYFCHNFIVLSLQLEEASEMSVKIGKNSVSKNLKTFALQNFGMLFGLALMFILAVYGEEISVG